MILQEGDIVGYHQSMGKIEWIEGEKVGIKHFVLDIGFVPLLSSSYVTIEKLEFIHRPLDFKVSQQRFLFYEKLLREDEANARELMREYEDKIDRKKGVSEHLLNKPRKSKKSVEKKIVDKLKGMSMNDILKLLES